MRTPTPSEIGYAQGLITANSLHAAAKEEAAQQSLREMTADPDNPDKVHAAMGARGEADAYAEDLEHLQYMTYLAGRAVAEAE